MNGYCVVCGKPKNKKYFCSRECFAIHRTHWKICVVCGKKFACPLKNKTKCCSSECSHLNRVNMGKTDIYAKTVESMKLAKEKFNESHSGEKNVNSKYWKIQSPEGIIYECQNLFHFLKEHQELYDGTPRQAMDGISHIKASKQGKRKHPVHSWKGWLLLDWSNERLAELNKE